MSAFERQQLQARAERLATDKKRIEDQLKRVANGDVTVQVGGATLPREYQEVLGGPIADVVSKLLTVELVIVSHGLCVTRKTLAQAVRADSLPEFQQQVRDPDWALAARHA